MRLVPALLVSACIFLSGCEKSAGNKADDWIKAGNYTRAEQVLNEAINQDPKDAGARIKLAHVYILETKGSGAPVLHRIEEAFNTLDEAAKVGGASSEIAQGLDECYDVLNQALVGPNTDVQQQALALAQRKPSAKLVDGLKTVVGSPTDSIAFDAELILRSVDPAAAHSALVKLMSGSNTALRIRAAKRLWAAERYDPARVVLRDFYVAALRSEQTLAGAEDRVGRLLDLGFDIVGDALAQVVRDASVGQVGEAPGVAALNALVARNDPRASQMAVAFLPAINSLSEVPSRCTLLALGFVRALEAQPSRPAFEALKKTFSYVFVHQDSRFECMAPYMAALAKNDGPDWQAIRSWYQPGSWPIFGVMIPGMISETRGNRSSSSYDSSRWTLVAPGAAGQFSMFIQLLGPYSPILGGRRLEFVPQQAVFDTPRKLALKLAILDSNRGNQGVGTVTLQMEAIGSNQDQPWEITGISAFNLDNRVLMR